MSFNVCGPLPRGVTVLEASAGTGKTATIAALTARYVAEGTPIERLLLVTFTRMATGELRERVRDRLVAVERGLARGESGDPVVELLAREDVEGRRARLRTGLARFDSATIVTTHGFCQEMLASLGIAADVDPDVEFVEDLGDLVEEVIDDLYVRRFHRQGAPAFDRAEAGAIPGAAVANPGVPIVTGVGEVAAMRGRLAEAVREELEARKRHRRVMTYDDLLTRLDAVLEHAGAVRRLRERYTVALVDEFQDTDPIQWRIVRRAFGGDAALVLIGDPKQAIYAFRGADVYAYLNAAAHAPARASLTVNRRSDQALLDAYDALFAGARLGHEGIVYREVQAAHTASRLTGAPHPEALRVRVVDRRDPAISLTARGYAGVPSARAYVAADLAADVVALLSSTALVDGTPVCPADVAVLVPTNASAVIVRDALHAVRVPCVVNGTGSVFATPAAEDWRRMLEAIERPTSAGRARSAALTELLGWTAERIALAGEAEWEELHARLHEWAAVLRRRGMAALVQTLTLGERLPARLLGQAGGERRLTDLAHVGELLHAASIEEQMGATALAAWLRRRIAEADRDSADEARSRRLESDAQAVQVLTVHRSKGLEFPIVYAPFLWEDGYIRKEVPVCFHDPDDGDARKLDVALEGRDFARHARQFVAEQRGEELRLAYVALTRARHQAVLWWAGSYNCHRSPLGRLLFARDASGVVAQEGPGVPADAEVVARLGELAAAAPGRVSVDRARRGLAVEFRPPLPAAATLETASFTRTLDPQWRRASFSSITAAADEGGAVASEPEEGLLDDELEPAAEEPAGAGASPLAAMPGGVHVGTLVHRVLEAADFAAADLEGELAGAVGAAFTRRAVDVGDPDAVVAGLAGCLRTPLGAVVGGLRLCDVTRHDRLDELRFELPLVGGDLPRGRLTLEALAGVLAAHLTPDDPFASYIERLADPALQQSVRGYLNGSLDLVARLPGGAFAIVDYKTNRLADYGAGALAEEMTRSHYALQAILYSVALHRYLRWRLGRSYDPASSFAGVLYLFLRGMGEGSSGVFAWRPPAGLLDALSDVFDGRVAG